MFEKNEYIAHRREKDGEMHWLSLHLEEVSKKTGEFASKIGLKEQGEIIGLLHDIGKASLEFEQYIKSAVGLIDSDEDDYVNPKGLKGKIDHSTAGSQFIFNNLFAESNETRFVAQVLALCIASHHTGILDCITPDGGNAFLKRMKKSDEKTHLKEILKKTDANVIKDLKNSLRANKICPDVIANFKHLKAEEDSQETLAFKCGLLVRFLFSCLIDADRLSTADFEHPRLAQLRSNNKYERWPILIKRLEEKLKLFKQGGINVVRQKIAQGCLDFSSRPKGLYQLTVPTGGGKTFASLRFALHHAAMHKMDRIIYVVPFTTIIDQNAEEIRKVLEEKNKDGKYLNKIVLEHHSNLMPDRETARQKVLSENWDAPVVLTTSVQVLETLFGSGTRGARRMHQLANAVIIFDEVQAMPIKCIHMFNSAIKFIVNNCGSTVVLCTATQPLLDRIEPKSRALTITNDQQIMPDSRQLFVDLKRVEVLDKRKSGGWTNIEVKEFVEKDIKEMGSVLVIVNTKKSAQQIYTECKQIKDVEVYHLSTYMCPAHRLVVLNEIKQSKNPVICVSTQLIEAGVDISFVTVIRFLAGLDSIAQAAGRCNRHNEFAPRLGKVAIINSAEENIDKLEYIRIGQDKANRILDEFKADPERFEKDLIGIEAMEQYYQYYFFQRKDKMNYPVNARSAVGRDDNLFNLLSINTASVEEYNRINKKVPEIPFRQAFMTAAEAFQAIETISRGIVVPYGKEGKELINKLCSVQELDKQYKLIHRAQRYSVNLFPEQLERLQKSGAVHEAQEESGILYLNEEYYSDEFGVSEKPVKDADFLGA